MKKLIILMILLLLTGCSYFQKAPVQQIVVQPNCTDMGFIPVEDANKLVDLTNRLVDISNVCFLQQNLTPLPKLAYWKDTRIKP